MRGSRSTRAVSLFPISAGPCGGTSRYESATSIARAPAVRRSSGGSRPAPTSTRSTISTASCSSTAPIRRRSPPGSSSTAISETSSCAGSRASTRSSAHERSVTRQSLVRARLARWRAGGARGGDRAGRGANRLGDSRRREPAAGGALPPGSDHAGTCQCALARIPAGPARADPGRARGLLDVAGANVRGRRRDRPRPLPRTGPRHLRRNGAGGDHGSGRVPLSPSRPRRHPLRGPERHGERGTHGRPRSRDPDHPARHLLPARRVRPGAGGRPAPLFGWERGGVDAAGQCARGGPRSAGRRGDPQRPGGGSRSRGGRRSNRGRPILASPRPPLRAARRERGVRCGVWQDAGRGARGGRCPLGAFHGGPRHSPRRGRLCAARRPRMRGLPLPDHRARPCRRRGTGRPARGGGCSAVHRHGLPRGDRPLRGGPGGRARRAARQRRAGQPLLRRAVARRDRGGLREHRVAGRGTARARRARRPGHSRPRQRAPRGNLRGPSSPVAGLRRDGGGRATRDRGRTIRRPRRHPSRPRRARRAGKRDRGAAGMSSLAIENIGLLVTNDEVLGEGPLGIVRDATLVFDGDRVAAVERRGAQADTSFDAAGRCVLPGFVDSHTHLVFAGDRSEEFAARMAGKPYEASGIRITTEATREASDEQLRALAAARRAEALRSGITHLEIKSGYGLEVATERRLCEIAAELTDDVTFLGAHAVPEEYEGQADDYVELVCGEMLAACAPPARWIDVFCEKGAFDAEQSRAVLEAGRSAGLGLRVHGNQLGPGPGIRLAVETGAAAVDHCTYFDDGDIHALASGDTVATFLPATDFSTRQPYPDARRMIDAGARVAIATNTNPGSSNTTSMGFCIALAVRDMGMTVEEAVRAATLGGATAVHRDDLGRLAPGARGDAVVLDAPTYVDFVYRPGVPLTGAVFLAGREAWVRRSCGVGAGTDRTSA